MAITSRVSSFMALLKAREVIYIKMAGNSMVLLKMGYVMAPEPFCTMIKISLPDTIQIM